MTHRLELSWAAWYFKVTYITSRLTDRLDFYF